ncbi:MFS transporter [Streptomyces sp. MP131-18]|uniref:MFS transporter n=1 Tax=Streptomyces sp. MP131-18 TaxID=1857892 RepID=UPI00097C97BF|nr:MFS transporter [Streptomyces sp. MP131-18]ONK09874.1 phosphoglycerate transporter family protein [Streptomyces sp. MP131-18]
MLTAAMGLGPASLYAVTALSPQLLPVLGAGERLLGLAVGASFAVASLASAAAGAAVDRHGGVLFIRLIAVFSALTAVLLTVQVSTATLVLAVAVAGLAQAAANPATNEIIARAAPRQGRARAVGLKQSGVPGSQLLAGAALPPIAALGGVRWAFAALALTAVVLVVPALRMRAGPPVRRAVRGGRVPLSRQVRIVLGVSFCSGATTQATNAYLALFAHGSLGLGATAAGAGMAVVGGVGIAGRVLWTRAHAAARRPPLVLTVLTAGGLAASVLLLAAAAFGAIALFWAAVVVHALCAMAVPGVVFLTVMDLVPAHAIGTVSGYVGICQFAGFAGGPLLAGLMVGAVGYPAVWTAVAGLGAVALLLAVAAARRN